MAAPVTIRDRIKELRRVPSSELIHNPKNWRRHPQAQQDALRAVLQEIGYAGALLAREVDGKVFLIDGHLRAEITPNEQVPVLILDVNEQEADKLLTTYDPLSAMAEKDDEALKSLLQSVQFNEPVLKEWTSTLVEMPRPPLVEPSTQIDKAEELRKKWGTELGQLWEIGPHRLWCGDNRDELEIERLLASNLIDLGVTSPPYAVGKEYEAEVSFTEHIENLRRCASLCVNKIIKPGGFLFTNFDEIAPLSHAGPLTHSKRQCVYPISKDYWQIFHEELGCDLYAQRVWYKPFSRLQQPFWSYHTSIPHHQEWEHIWTWRTPGGEGDEVFNWDISVHAIWDTRSESTDDKPLTRHSAAFPVCLPGRAIQAHSRAGQRVYDPYCGSGTTLVAAHQLNRIGYGIEIDPGYVAVTLQRLADLGLQPKLVSG